MVENGNGTERGGLDSHEDIFDFRFAIFDRRQGLRARPGGLRRSQAVATGRRLARRASPTRGARPEEEIEGEEDGNIWAQRELRPAFGEKIAAFVPLDPACPAWSRVVPPLIFFGNMRDGQMRNSQCGVRNGKEDTNSANGCEAGCWRTVTERVTNVGESGADPDCFSRRTPRARRGTGGGRRQYNHLLSPALSSAARRRGRKLRGLCIGMRPGWFLT